jgi:hypothetical protein
LDISPHLHDSPTVSRRQLLRSVSAVILAVALPAWLLPARAQSTGKTFDFYVSPTGSDRNPGTLAEPWAITSLSLFKANAYNVANCQATAGKRVGFLPGTYYLTTAFTGSINSGSNQMTVSGITGAIAQGMHLVSGLGSAYTPGSLGWGPQIMAISGNTITLSSNAAATLTNATIVATLMTQDPVLGGLQLIGSTSASSPTYWGSSNSSGYYSPRTATLDAEGGSGVPGGFISTSVATESGPVISHTGQYPTSYTVSNATLDGLRLTRFSYSCIRIGGYSSDDGPSGITGVTIQNCEITGGSAAVSGFKDNVSAIWIDCTSGTVVTNNWIHDNVGWSSGAGDHLSAIIVWGSFAVGSYTTSGTVIQYNTCVNAGNIYGKEKYIEATNVQNNYIDASMFSENSAGIQDFTGAPVSGLTRTTVIRNNVILLQGNTAGENVAFGGPTLSNSYGWTTPLQVYNNTVIVTAGSAGPTVAWLTGSGGATDAVQYYNNIYVNYGSGGSWNGFGNFYVNPAAPQIWDYNLVPASGVTWTLYENSSFTAPIASYSEASAFSSALASNGGISGAEAHSIAGIPIFTNSGALAEKYQLAPGSLGKNAGSTNGMSSGSVCDMGAWGGANPPTQIGCSFAAGANSVPKAPVLSII